MKFPHVDHKLTGILVPVSALRSRAGAGVGEFADLPLLADWCADIGAQVIQILPVNDTGSQSSPYSALSAFALHPIYLRLQDIPEVERAGLTGEVDELRNRYASEPRLRYGEVLSAKLRVLDAAFGHCRADIAADGELDRWIERNPWIRPYALFCALKRKNNGRAWTDWAEMQQPTLDEIDAGWEADGREGSCRYHAWVQFRLEQQLCSAAAELDRRGILLKGDLPILMNEDSADAWAHRDIFNPALRAGAPPDMFSALGQNWDFPIYNWDNLAQNDYDWWKRRLLQADKFYHAFRIDHVLGFFRIWAIPHEHFSGTLGHFFPSQLLSRQSLRRAGFDEGRIRWLAEPHLGGDELREQLGDHAHSVIERLLRQIEDQDLYRFAPHVSGERDIASADLPEEVRRQLLHWYRDRALLQVEADRFAPAWLFRDCSRYIGLTSEEKARFEQLVKHANSASELGWEEQGRRLLAFMNHTTGMLACAEDLGVIPKCVPSTLEDLGILGLRLPRWERPDGVTFRPIDRFPEPTVCAPSVHDTTTLRQWWEDEVPDSDRPAVLKGLRIRRALPPVYDSATAWRFIEAMLKTSSRICVFQIQDLFAVDELFRLPAAADERVNVPGTFNDINWTYRIPEPLEQLAGRSATSARLRELIAGRTKRSSP